MHCGHLNAEKVQMGGAICVRVTDSLCRRVETNVPL